MKKMNQYFNNQLPEQEQDQITRQLLTEHYDRKLKERWKTILEEEHNVLPPEKINTKPKRINLYRAVGLAAASIALFFIAIQVFQTNMNSQPDYKGVVAQHLAKPYPDIGLKKGLSVEDARTRAKTAYSKKDYISAIRYYEEVRIDKNCRIEDVFYLGLCYLYNKQATKAIAILKEAREMEPSTIFRSKKIIDWYLSLAYLESEQITSAKSELQKIVDDKDGAEKKAARQLLKLLEDL